MSVGAKITARQLVTAKAGFQFLDAVFAVFGALVVPVNDLMVVQVIPVGGNGAVQVAIGGQGFRIRLFIRIKTGLTFKRFCAER